MLQLLLKWNADNVSDRAYFTMHRFYVFAAATVVLLCSSFAQTERLQGFPSWMNISDSPSVRASALLREMSLEEKITMLHGPSSGSCCECDEKEGPLCNYTGNIAPNSRLGIPQIKMNDGPQGFRDNKHPGTSTSWPSALTVAASWDEELMMAYGVAMGKEFAGKGANVQLGPGVCVARVPHNGRNFEYEAALHFPRSHFVTFSSCICPVKTPSLATRLCSPSCAAFKVKAS